MSEPFAHMLLDGGKTNSLGRANEVIEIVLNNKSRLPELYECLRDDDAWVRMRAADALEKICRGHPDWLEPYIDKFIDEYSSSAQPSIRWHLAQIYEQVELTHQQKVEVIDWLTQLLSTSDVDWIVSANAMDTLAKFVHSNDAPRSHFITLLKIQQNHKSNAIVKRADKFLAEFS